MKTIKDKKYSMKHTQQRMEERYGISITDAEYDYLCDLIKFKVDCTLVNIERQASSIQETYRVLFKGGIVNVVWNASTKQIKTVLPIDM